MFNFFSKVFGKKSKKIAFIDGDQPISGLVRAYHKYLRDCPETIFVKMKHPHHNEPKALKKVPKKVKRVYLEDVRTGKEAVDKFIGAYIQKAISDGYTDVTVVSSDYDFIDIFKLSVMIDNAASKVSFTLIVPDVRYFTDLECKETNIKVIKDK